MTKVDINQLLSAIESGKLTVKDATLILNAAARFNEREDAIDETHNH